MAGKQQPPKDTTRPLRELRLALEKTIVVDTIRCQIQVVRRNRADKFHLEDLELRLLFYPTSPADRQNLVIDNMPLIWAALQAVLQLLQEEFPNDITRMVDFIIHSTGMLNAIFLGYADLHQDASLIDRLCHALNFYLMSNATLTLQDAELSMKCTVISLSHVEDLAAKKLAMAKNKGWLPPPPEDPDEGLF